MDDEDPSTNGRATIVIISFSIVKWVYICGLPSSMILQKKSYAKHKKELKKKKTFNTYKNKIKKIEIKNHFKINHNIYTYPKVINQNNKSKIWLRTLTLKHNFYIQVTLIYYILHHTKTNSRKLKQEIISKKP
jgi:hypothetical protein